MPERNLPGRDAGGYPEGGFLEACRQREIETVALDFPPERTIDSGYYPDILKFLKQNEGIDGLFCGSDVIAAEAIQAAAELGISTPDS